MGFKAEVLRVLIASPSDVSQERDEIEQAIFKWNTVYSENMQVVLLPARWENVAPTYRGEDPQQILNEKLVSKCDLLIGVFWKKLGSATASHPSGTLEEIDLFIQQEKEIMLYFVDKHITMDEDFSEIQRVQAYKKEYQAKGLYYKYDITKIVEHLYTKVTDYKRKSSDVTNISQESSVSFGPLSTGDIKNEELLSIESMILSGVLTDSELLLIKFIMDTEERYLGSRLKSEHTLAQIKEWQIKGYVKEVLSDNYDKALMNLVERGLLGVAEYTSEGNPKTYMLPLSKLDQLRMLSDDVKGIITQVELDYVELPF
ncbi:hypothetical protein B1B04_13190 [Lysinibacillus sp. KCTC 33748]|uniref:hypothetical protein n=1 Tax=unclassified Lysinibacillus TaxID=2636778 RepID=UPI0009A85C4B|nr:MULTISPECIES: hypothetical protein [unclassified Lysinibacillus]OXS73234.1 hypothetical protein B1B04_13190 [Lysinibacillus sp. KCTC 33748]SKB83046.1 hypothetical protein SAMN06295926_10994 [Lysinibacillus sp. AC-3]